MLNLMGQLRVQIEIRKQREGQSQSARKTEEPGCRQKPSVQMATASGPSHRVNREEQKVTGAGDEGRQMCEVWCQGNQGR